MSGSVVPVGPPQRCLVLAALAADAGRFVSVETLIDRVWGDRPAQQARRGLHAHLTRIRRIVDGDGGLRTRLTRRADGYILHIDRDRVDWHRFHRLTELARSNAHNETERARSLSEALALWRGEPLAGLSGPWVDQTRREWRHQYLDTVVAWSHAKIAMGHADVVIAPLTALTTDHAFDEALAGLLMRALTLAGRKAQALEVFAAIRRRLVDELGSEPSAELQRIHLGVLRDDSDALRSRQQPAAPNLSVPSPVPAQLPAEIPGFVGRDAELASLDAFLDAGRGNVVVISGTAGVGKTSLALHWAHRIRHRFPDGQLHINLRGFDRDGGAVEPTAALRHFLHALGVPAERIIGDLGSLAALCRTHMANKRILVVLDNAHNHEQVRSLLPGEPRCFVLITSRTQLPGLIATGGAYPLPLDLLSPAEAEDLLERRLGCERTTAEPAAVQRIVARCARLPLALAIVAARAATQPHFPLSVVADQLFADGNPLDGFGRDDPAIDIRTVFAWSYQALTTAAATLFRLLGLHPAADISITAAASLAGISPQAARAPLAELVRMNIIEEHLPHRYTLHDLLRAYASELVVTVDGNSDRQSATRRMLDYYLHTAHRAAHTLNRYDEPITPGPVAPGVHPEIFDTVGAAIAWFAAEHLGLIAVVSHAEAAGLDTHVWQIALALNDFLNRSGLNHDWIVVQRAAVAAAERRASVPAQASAHRRLGHAYARQRQYAESHRHLLRAAELYGELGDRAGQAHTCMLLAYAEERHGRLATALDYAMQALSLHKLASDQRGYANALNRVGWLQAHLGNHQDALALCTHALALLQHVGDRDGQAETWDSLGFAYHQQGDYDQARSCYERALDLADTLGYRYLGAVIENRIGNSWHAAGELDAARSAWRNALTILDDLHHPDADRIRAQLKVTD